MMCMVWLVLFWLAKTFIAASRPDAALAWAFPFGLRVWISDCAGRWQDGYQARCATFGLPHGGIARRETLVRAWRFPDSMPEDASPKHPPPIRSRVSQTPGSTNLETD